MTDENGARLNSGAPQAGVSASPDNEGTAAPFPDSLAVTDRIFSAAEADERIGTAVRRLRELHTEGRWSAAGILSALEQAAREGTREG